MKVVDSPAWLLYRAGRRAVARSRRRDPGRRLPQALPDARFKPKGWWRFARLALNPLQ